MKAETQLENQKYVRLITKGKKPTYLNISIPKSISDLMELQSGIPVKLYVDDNNKMILEKVIL